MALIPSMSTALSGMKTAQAQLDIIGRNVANVDTVGYTRKYAQQNNVVRAGVPSGVQLGNIQRNVNEGLLKSFLGSNSTTGNMTSKSEYLSKTDILLGSPIGNNSITVSVTNLQVAAENFSTEVMSASARYSLLNSATSLTSRLNSLNLEIQKLRGDADIEISGAVTDINKYLDEISALNDSIVKYNVLGYDGVPDLEDKRDTALRNLSGLVDISYFTRENGEIVIQTNNGVNLLDKEPHYLSHNAIAQANAISNYETGGVNGIFVDGVDITKEIADGKLKGLIDIRDNTLPSLQIQLDELAGVMMNNINQVHNRGTAFPQSMSKLSGGRSFIDPAVQQIQINSGDVRFGIFNKEGKQVATTSLGGDLGFTSGSINDMVTAINTWISSPTGGNMSQGSAYVDSAGKLVIDTGDSNYTISILDEKSSTPGSGQEDVGISFDVDGDGVFDRQESGFSNFFKLNDFFKSNDYESVYDSKVLDRNVNLGVNTMTKLNFSSTSGGIDYTSVDIYPNDTIQNIVNRINNDPTLSQNMVASLVPNGNGVVLRIISTAGEQLEISEAAPGVGLINKLGLAPSKAGTAGNISVRKDIQVNPGLIVAGSPQFNQTSGQYELNQSYNNIANELAKAFTENQSFGQAGNLSNTQTTLANYAATFVGIIATATSEAEANLKYQSELTNAIATKEAQNSGVDMDEELSYLIMYQQSYAACAQSFTVSKEMLDMLLDLV